MKNNLILCDRNICHIMFAAYLIGHVIHLKSYVMEEEKCRVFIVLIYSYRFLIILRCDNVTIILMITFIIDVASVGPCIIILSIIIFLLLLLLLLSLLLSLLLLSLLLFILTKLPPPLLLLLLLLLFLLLSLPLPL